MHTSQIRAMKGKEAITVLTCYDYNTAQLLEEIGIDLILVGDSLGNVVLGFDSTQEVTMQDMIRHTGAVRRGAVSSFIVSDMPYKSDIDKEAALKNAQLLVDNGADAVKVEGKPEICKYLVENGVAVMGHIGYLPQTDGKPSVKKDFVNLLKQAEALQAAGVFALVMELVDKDTARKLTGVLEIPTIGIGSGPNCDGQVLVINDILGTFEDFKPKFARQYVNVNDLIRKGVKAFKKEVKAGDFPE